jgi:hypothetical protein
LIDFKTYQLTENNYHTEVYDKKQILIGNTNRRGMLHYASWIYRLNGKNKKTAAFTVTKEGVIYQHYDPKYYSNFLGQESDKITIPIVLENLGWFRKDSINNKYVDWLGNYHVKQVEEVLMKRWRNHLYWDIYTEEQLTSLKELIIQLCDTYNIDKKSIGCNVFNEDVDLFNGITFRSNYYQELTDVNPSFTFEVLNNL